MDRMQLANIPELVLLSALSFLVVEDQREFLRMNSEFLSLWKKVRIISVNEYNFFNQPLERINTILSMIHNPYNQLNLDFTNLNLRFLNQVAYNSAEEDSYSSEYFQERFVFETARQITINVKDVPFLLKETPFKQIQRLKILCSTAPEAPEEAFELLARKNASEGLLLKCIFVTSDECIAPKYLSSIPGITELIFRGCRFLDLQWLDGFRDANYLEFNACHFHGCDVKYLDHFHSLRLVSCKGLKDISCLKNNKTISMISCVEVEDISESFKNSRSIAIAQSLFHLNRLKSEVNISDYPNTREFTLQLNPKSSFQIPNQFSVHLKHLHITNFSGEILSLPSNSLKTLILEHSVSLCSINGIVNIPSITLKDLYVLNVVEECSHGNKKIQILNCSKLNDFAFLKYCETIILSKIKNQAVVLPIEVTMYAKEIRILLLSNQFYALIIGKGEKEQKPIIFKKLRVLEYCMYLVDLREMIFPQLEEITFEGHFLNSCGRFGGRDLLPLTEEQFPNLKMFVIVKRESNATNYESPSERFRFEKRPGITRTATFIKRQINVHEKVKHIQRQLEDILQYANHYKDIVNRYGISEGSIQALKGVLLDIEHTRRPRQTVIEEIKRFQTI